MSIPNDQPKKWREEEESRAIRVPIFLPRSLVEIRTIRERSTDSRFLRLQEVTGIYTNNFDAALNTKNGFPVFATLIEANFIHKKEDLFSAYKLTDEDKHEVLKMSKDPRIGQRVSQQSDSLKARERVHGYLRSCILLPWRFGLAENDLFS
jgi:hypothetical protein